MNIDDRMQLLHLKVAALGFGLRIVSLCRPSIGELLMSDRADPHWQCPWCALPVLAADRTVGEDVASSSTAFGGAGFGLSHT